MFNKYNRKYIYPNNINYKTLENLFWIKGQFKVSNKNILYRDIKKQVSTAHISITKKLFYENTRI